MVSSSDKSKALSENSSAASKFIYRRLYASSSISDGFDDDDLTGVVDAEAVVTRFDCAEETGVTVSVFVTFLLLLEER